MVLIGTLVKMPNARANQPPPRRRGRPKAGEAERRRVEVIEAALDELVENGVAQTTMASIAQRAGASKETLYAWFGSRDGLVAALIRHNADASAERVRRAVAGGDETLDTLMEFGANLLRLLTGPSSIALNRAAMTIPSLAEELLASGRHRVGPIVEEYLTRLDAAGVIGVDEPATAFETFYGLLIRDSQIRCLLGEPAPDADAIGLRSREAVEQFVALHPPRAA
jgi:AcrR family transcriptional regulator